MPRAEDLMGVGMSAAAANVIEESAAYADDNISNADAPTQAEMVTAFGAASDRKGMVGVIDDNGAGTAATICVSNGTSWFYVATTVGA